jgi:two-component system, OmpR family, response regulator
MRILIVEDQPEIALLMTERLRKAGFDADQVGAAQDAMQALQSVGYAAMLLDRRLPDGDGVAIIPQARNIQPRMRVLLVTAMREIDQRVAGLEAGADDYLTKPFAPDELVARIRACMRRSDMIALPAISVGNLSFDPNTQEAFVDGAPLLLPKTSLLLLGALMRRAGRAVTYPALIDEVYGDDEPERIGALKMLVMRLKQRLGERQARVEIHAPRGIGYIIREARS